MYMYVEGCSHGEGSALFNAFHSLVEALHGRLEAAELLRDLVEGVAHTLVVHKRNI